jgi:hypothetical protein
LHCPFILLFLPFEQIGQPAGDHVVAVLVPRHGWELAVLDRIPLGERDENAVAEDAVAGLVVVKQVAGSCDNFWRRCCGDLPLRAAVGLSAAAGHR